MACSSCAPCGFGLSLRPLSSDPPRLRLPLDPKPSPSSSLPGTRKISCTGTRRRMHFAVNSHMATEPKPAFSEDQMLVFVPPHPLIKHWVSVLRNEQTPCPIFKNAMAELWRLLMYKASRDWSTLDVDSGYGKTRLNRACPPSNKRCLSMTRQPASSKVGAVTAA